MRKLNIVLFSMVYLVMGGCSQYPVTFDSDPRGASLICNGSNFGYTPKTLYYEPDVNQDTLNINCFASWVSGAKMDYARSIPIDKYPDGAKGTAIRPNVDGYARDEEFALKVQEMRDQKRQEEAAAYEQRQRDNKSSTNQYKSNSSPSYTVPSSNYRNTIQSPNTNQSGTSVYDRSQCTGAVINHKCYGTIIPSGRPKKCYGKMINGRCSGAYY